jgi:hypothetical protein
MHKKTGFHNRPVLCLCQQFRHVIDKIKDRVSGYEVSDEDFDTSSAESVSGLATFKIPDLYSTNRAIPYLDAMRPTLDSCDTCQNLNEEMC